MEVGIIGGADGPTQIFLASSGPWGWMLAIAAVLVVAVAAFFLIHHQK